ncbi:hypothetical protein BVRB_5g125070 [Beta vulgaris subsp. vulgaris]|uniref:Uncharacterized protein n=1 Tax=Beta vulgaris subsp. vulgaris TaxID=3555 RepID=A0A0J8B9L6_BETVV|nr:hypothetical protein BVRB_5g125070 [Beta vulgaris subsp. vulgaris]
MEVSTIIGRASFGTQADALFRKSLIYQKRNKSQNCCLLITPLVIVAFCGLLERYMVDISKADTSKDPKMTQEIRDPFAWPPAVDIPSDTTRAVRFKYMPFTDLPPPSCRDAHNCPVSLLFTGTNRSFVMSMFTIYLSIDTSSSNFIPRFVTL